MGRLGGFRACGGLLPDSKFRDVSDLALCSPLVRVIPAQAGMQRHWVPACAGMTICSFKTLGLPRALLLNAVGAGNKKGRKRFSTQNQFYNRAGQSRSVCEQTIRVCLRFWIVTV
jgi:hypothetical protein